MVISYAIMIRSMSKQNTRLESIAKILIIDGDGNVYLRLRVTRGVDLTEAQLDMEALPQ